MHARIADLDRHVVSVLNHVQCRAACDDGRVLELAEYSGKDDLSCYSVTEADRLNASISRSTTINGRVQKRFATSPAALNSVSKSVVLPSEISSVFSMKTTKNGVARFEAKFQVA